MGHKGDGCPARFRELDDKAFHGGGGGAKRCGLLCSDRSAPVFAAQISRLGAQPLRGVVPVTAQSFKSVEMTLRRGMREVWRSGRGYFLEEAVALQQRENLSSIQLFTLKVVPVSRVRIASAGWRSHVQAMMPAGSLALTYSAMLGLEISRRRASAFSADGEPAAIRNGVGPRASLRTNPEAMPVAP